MNLREETTRWDSDLPLTTEDSDKRWGNIGHSTDWILHYHLFSIPLKTFREFPNCKIRSNTVLLHLIEDLTGIDLLTKFPAPAYSLNSTTLTGWIFPPRLNVRCLLEFLSVRVFNKVHLINWYRSLSHEHPTPIIGPTFSKLGGC